MSKVWFGLGIIGLAVVRPNAGPGAHKLIDKRSIDHAEWDLLGKENHRFGKLCGPLFKVIPSRSASIDLAHNELLLCIYHMPTLVISH